MVVFSHFVVYSGIFLHLVRQRLLEESTVTIYTAFRKPRSLGIEQKHYEPHICLSPCTSTGNSHTGWDKYADDRASFASAVHKIVLLWQKENAYS